MEYELHAVGERANGTRYRIPDYNPIKDKHRLRGYLLIIRGHETYRPYTRSIGDRYVLRLRSNCVEFELTYTGVQKWGADDPDKYWDRQVIEYMRQRFADRALPLLASHVPESSKLWTLKRFQDAKGKTLDQLIGEVL